MSVAEWDTVTRLLREHLPGVPVWAFRSLIERDHVVVQR
jgi:hypothetical protein